MFAGQLMIDNGIRKALERDEIESGKLAGLEALIQWNHPVYGVISPGEFIPVAEETDSSFPLVMGN
jgi:EAL domain-containing protein (putative c-di-GMP-specific phosphodiesterase class I)